MLGAPDGHAKNFSIALLPEGRYSLTPVYDVMSIWPMEGSGPNQFSRHDAKLAMAMWARTSYRFEDVERRHFNSTAARCHYGSDAEDLIQPILRETRAVVDRVYGQLPRDFPVAVANTVLDGFVRSAKALEAMPARQSARFFLGPADVPRGRDLVLGALDAA